MAEIGAPRDEVVFVQMTAQDGASVALEVEDFEAAVATLREHNVPMIIGPMETPVCHMATVRDPDGNKLTLHRRKAR